MKCGSKICKTLEDAYNLSKIDSVTIIDGGIMGENFCITTGDCKYFLRKYRPYTLEKIKTIHSAKKYFGDAGVPVILPITTINSGETYVQIDGAVYSLFPFVDGKHIYPEDMLDVHLSSFGNFLAEMHLIGRDATKPKCTSKIEIPKTDFIGEANLILNNISKIKNKDSFDILAIEALKFKILLAEEFKQSTNNFSIDNKKYKKHLIHNDFHERNIFMSDNGDIEAIFDLEKVKFSRRAKEVIRAMEIIIFNNGYTNETFKKAKIFFDAYNCKYPISKEELIGGFMDRYKSLVHSSWIESEHYAGNLRVDKLLKQEHDRLKYYYKYRDTWIDKFFE